MPKMLSATLRGLRSLMPHTDAFTDGFVAHSVVVAEAAALFREMLPLVQGSAGSYLDRIRDAEHRADAIEAHLVKLASRTNMVVPFDRGEVVSLAKLLDNVADLIKNAADDLCLYRVALPANALAMADCLVQAADEIVALMPLLYSMSSENEAIAAACARVDAIESRADRLFAAGKAEVFAGTDGLEIKMQMKGIYEMIEEIVDACEKVTKAVSGIVLEHV